MRGVRKRLQIWIALGVTLAGSLGAGPVFAHGLKTLTGVASFYDEGDGGPTASGAHYDAKKFTAAHRTLPFGTRLRVTDTETNRSVVVVINDRGPFIEGRFLDLSLAAAKALDMTERGLVNVKATMTSPSPARPAQRATRRGVPDPCLRKGNGTLTETTMNGDLVPQLNENCLARAVVRQRRKVAEPASGVIRVNRFAAQTPDPRLANR